jgi:hypothetical protein
VGGLVAADFGLVGTIATPLSQTNFFPDFTHVYFLFRQITVCPTRVHLRLGTCAASVVEGFASKVIPERICKICLREKYDIRALFLAVKFTK